MRFHRAFLVCLGLPPLLSGCLSNDHMLQGPYLIGTHEPVVQDGKCRDPESVRAADANKEWTPCRQVNRAQESYTDIKPPVQGFDPGPVDLTADPYPASKVPEATRTSRSAWE